MSHKMDKAEISVVKKALIGSLLIWPGVGISEKEASSVAQACGGEAFFRPFRMRSPIHSAHLPLAQREGTPLTVNFTEAM
jgi:hypothetical protein